MGIQKEVGLSLGITPEPAPLTCQSTRTDPPPWRNKTPEITSIRIYNSGLTGIFLVQCAPSVPSGQRFCSNILSRLFYKMKFETFRVSQRLCIELRLVAIKINFYFDRLCGKPKDKNQTPNTLLLFKRTIQSQ